MKVKKWDRKFVPLCAFIMVEDIISSQTQSYKPNKMILLDYAPKLVFPIPTLVAS